MNDVKKFRAGTLKKYRDSAEKKIYVTHVKNVSALYGMKRKKGEKCQTGNSK